MSALPDIELTDRQLDILSLMAAHRHDEDGELVFERGIGYVGLTRVHWRTLKGLLQACAISMDQGSRVGGFERYHINETGLAALAKARGTSPL